MPYKYEKTRNISRLYIIYCLILTQLTQIEKNLTKTSLFLYDNNFFSRNPSKSAKYRIQQLRKDFQS